MRAVVFGGTTEGRELAYKLAGLDFEVVVSVATPLGAEELGPQKGIEVRSGRLQTPQMAELLSGAAVCVDATHPYAVEVTRNICAAAKEAGVEYLRLGRAQSALPEGCMVFGTAAEAAEALSTQNGNILLTTGAKELGAFAALPPEGLYPRVLPTHEGIAACEALGIPHRNIIAMQGPFTRAMNEAIIAQFGIKCLVTKDGGAAGGFAEKAEAAKNTGARLIVLRRPPEGGSLTFDEILRRCEEMLEK